MWQLIVGIVLIIITGISLVCSIVKTPENLRGWYGVMFGLISMTGFIGGIVLTVLGAMSIV